jgi:hypothetical protein
VLKIKVTTTHPQLSTLFLRQTPKGLGIWKHCEFFVDSEIDRYDWWFVCHESSIREDQTIICDPKHVVFISMEPREWGPEIFYRQFNHLVACDPSLKHRSIQLLNAITWWAGIQVDFADGHIFSPVINQDYDSLSSLKPPVKKSDRISVITSNNSLLPGHLKRLAFIDRLKSSPLAEHIDFYGGGHNPIPDKLDALLPYKYHLALENSVIPNYWTEKIADAWLGYCLPIYYGCPTISCFFPDESYIQIDIEDESIIPRLQHLISSDIYSNRLTAISAARKLVLDEYNIFNLMASIATKPASRYAACRIQPANCIKPTLSQRIASKLNRTFTKFIS